MRQITEKTSEIIRQLCDGRSKSFSKSSERRQFIISLLNQLGAAKEPTCLPFAARFLTDSNRAIQDAARTTVAELMATVSPYDVIHLSDRAEWSYSWYITDDWHKLSPPAVAGLAGSATDDRRWAVLGMLSFHSNGYVRHEALRQLASLHDGRELPFLLIRQNDWVEVIAADAQAAVAERMHEEYLDHFARSLRLLLHLTTLSRRDHEATVRRVVDMLLQNQHEDLLSRVMENSDRETRRQIVRRGLNMSGPHQVRLVGWGIGIDDPQVRLDCCLYMTRAGAKTARQADIARLTADPFMPVRRAAFMAQAELFPELAAEMWQRALLDVHRSVRALARFSLRRLGQQESDFANCYRTILAQEPNCLTAVEGLSETADAEDVGYLRELLGHPWPSRRVAAIRGLSRILKESVATELLPLLEDSSPNVLREVREALQPYCHSIAPKTLIDIALRAESECARRNAVELVDDLGKWPSIPWLLTIAASSNRITARFALEKIILWLTPPRSNKVFTRPSQQQKREIESALQRFQGAISTDVVRLLSEELRLSQ